MIFDLKPVDYDKHGRCVADYEVSDFYEKIGEELMEAHTQAVFADWMLWMAKRHNVSEEPTQEQAAHEVIELLDLMTATATRIDALAKKHGFSDERLAEMQGYVVNKNRDRGYFDET